MFTNTIKGIMIAAFVVLGGIVAANAQIENGRAIKFTVDHPFVVKNKTLPAGQYVITQPLTASGDDNILLLQSRDGKESMFFSTMEKTNNRPSKETELVFDNANGEYILAEIKMSGDDTAVEIEKTKSEKQALTAAGVE